MSAVPWPDHLLSFDLVVVRRDRSCGQMYEYSDAGIPSYWILDVEHPRTLTAHQLVGGKYKIVAEDSAKPELREPAPVTIDVAALLPRRT
jgi:Putative restriction endonuclease